MRRPIALFSLSLLCSTALLADDRTRDVQAELKTAGFYFGEVDGQAGASTTAALKRYQIRNGLEVTGEINSQTLQALGIGGAPAPAAAPEESAPAPTQIAPPPVPRAPQAEPPPVNLRRDESTADSDRRTLRQEEIRRAPGPRGEGRPPLPGGDGPPNQPSERYRGIFAGTPYATAPRVVQEETFLRAQRILSDRGLLPGAADGAPGPATDDAILGYQRSSRLPATGRLDLETLAALHLLPGRGAGNPGMAGPGGPNAGPGGPNAGPGPNRVARPMPYKGIWVQ